ncbi:hypothetical protein ACQKRQ_34325 [Paraburkholderia sp. NPDC080076]|jgi:hypothetical protein|uniref:hypothetical protein n=1 Tax=Paraburkholderia sp. NPDC080076 TaxID=3390605 RepID=UPI003D032C6A
MRIEKFDSFITGEDVKKRLVELDAVLKALDAADCDDERDSLMPEFTTLKKLECDVCNVLARAWSGEILVRDTAFAEYVRAQAEERCGTGWPMSHVNWERAADDARVDWLSVEFDGVTYWVR